jgi:phytoene desaturase
MEQKTQEAIVIGSGVAGMVAAIRLRGKGFGVSVFEANEYPGGKLSQMTLGNYRFDSGPSLFTMPHFVDEVFESVGKNPRDYYSYKRKDVVCKYFYPDGTEFTAYSDRDLYVKTASEVFQEKKEAIERYFDRSKLKYDRTADLFLKSSLHKASTFLNIKTVEAILDIGKLGLYNTLHEENSKYFRNDKLIQLFNRYATYNGSSPYLTPGIMSMIPHLEQHYGTFIPKGGMVSITTALFQLAQDLGVKFFFNNMVHRIVVKDKVAQGIEADRFYPADVVVSNMDIVPSYRKLLQDQKAPEKTLAQERSSSAVIFYWGIRKSFPQLDLHNIFFASDYKKEFDAIFRTNSVSDDITVYVNISSKDVAEDAPHNCENWFVMVNAPGNKGQDWDVLVAKIRARVIEKLSATLGVDLESLIEEETSLDPRTIESRTSSYQGSLYGAASNDRMAAFLRHPNFSTEIRNLFFCGGSVHPGGGIPLCVLSGKIVSDLVKLK